MFIRNTLIAASVALLFTAPAFAQDAHGSHNMKGMPMHGAQADLYKDAMDKMHKDMAVEPTGDADADFVRGMIPHHQGAIDMAKVVLANGKDPEIRKLAEAVISAQEGEIAFMKDWLKKHGQ